MRKKGPTSKQFYPAILLVLVTFLTIDLHAQSWTLSTPDPNFYYLTSAHFFDANTGILCGQEGVMKKTVNGGKTWTALTTNTTNNLWDLFFLNSSIGYAVGENGTIRKTIDGGVTWNAQTASGTSGIRFYGVHFPDIATPNLGVIVGTNGVILKTTNGTTWSSKTSGTTDWIMSLHFPTTTVGFAATNGGKVLKTTDAGDNWAIQASGTTNSLYDVYFVDQNTGWAVGYGGAIYKTITGGVSWAAQTSNTTNHLLKVRFVDANNGMAVGDNGAVVITTNGGTTWTLQNTGTTYSMMGLALPTFSTAYMPGYGGQMLKYQSVTAPVDQPTAIAFTDVFGTSMTVSFTDASGPPAGYLAVRKTGSTPPNAYPLDGVEYLTVGAALDDGVIAYSGPASAFPQDALTGNTTYSYQIFSFNGTGESINYQTTTPLTGTQVTYASGQPWTQVDDPSFTAYDTHFYDANVGAYVGTYTLRTTTNGGATWTERFPGAGQIYAGVYFTSATTAYAVGGANANIFVEKTTDGGVTWNAQTISSPGNFLMDVLFTDANTGYVVGTGGIMFKTINAGTTWTPMTSGTTQTLNAISFANNLTTGYVVGAGGTILKTINSGTSWAPLTSGTTNELFGVSSNTANTAYAVGASGTIIKTINGGTNWATQTSFASDVLSAVTFVNTNTGYIVGFFGMILKTTNGGGSWIQQTTNTSTDNHLRGICMVNLHFGVAAGQRVFKYQSVPEPSAQATGLVLGSIASTTLTGNFTAATDLPSGYVVVRKAGGQPTTAPADGTAYTAGATLGDGIVAYSGTTTTFNDTGLSPATQYFYRVYSYNISSSASSLSLNYLTSSPLQGNVFTYATEPTAQPTSLTFGAATSTGYNTSFTAATGSPSGYLVLRKLGSAPTGAPGDGTTYTAGATLGDGTVAYVGSSIGFTESGLTPATAYFYSVYSYAGTGTSINYRQSSPLTGSKSTIATAPTAQATAPVFSNITNTTLTLAFTSSSPASAGYIVLRKAGSAMTASPVNATAYTVGATLGDAIVASVGTSTTVNESSLAAGTEYFYRVFSFNGSGATLSYYFASPLNTSASTVANQPSTQPSNLVFTSTTTTSFTVSYTAAVVAPTGYIVLKQSGTAPTTDPVDGTTYTTSSTIGGASVVLLSAALTFDESALTPGTTYFYRVLAFNGSGATINYNTISPLTGSRATLTIAPESIAATAPTQTSFTANWNAASGASSYSIDVSSDNFTTMVAGFSNLAVASGTTVAVTGLQPGIAYQYRVRAENSSGASANSNAIAQITIPATPTANAATLPGQTGFTASWTAATGATAYLLDVSSNNFATYATGYSSKSITGTSEIVSGLSPGVEWQYRVRSSNAAGVSPTSNVVTQLLIPATPVALDAVNVRANDMVAKWNDVDGETGYELDVSVDGFATYVTGFQSKPLAAGTIQADVSGLQSNTAYKYRVRAKNATGISPHSNVITVSTQASGGVTPITFGTQVSASVIKTGTPAATSISVTGGNGALTVSIKYKGVLATTYSSQSAPLKSGTTYETSLTDVMADAVGIEYFFSATDGTSTVEQSTHTFVYRSVEGTAESIPFATGLDGSSDTYQMFSVPYVLTEKNIGAVFDELGSYDQTKWRLFHYQNKRNVEFNDGLVNIELGRGYWFNAKEKIEVKPGPGIVTSVSAAQQFTLTLDQGWNQIGDPYPFNLDWAKVVAANSAAGLNSLWGFESASYIKKTVLATWKGAYVFSDNGGTVTFPLNAQTSSAGREVADVVAELNSAQWNVPITLALNNITSSAGIGMHPLAKNSKDKFDEILAPRFFNYVELSTHHPEFFAHEFATDIQPGADQYTWTFKAESNLKGSAILTWDHTLMTGAASMILIDDQTKDWVDMRTNGSYQFDLHGERTFSIVFNRDGTFSSDGILVGSAYPNPFAEQVVIPVLAGKDGDVDLQVIDMQGRVVHQYNGNVQQGIQNIIWDGRAGDGTTVAPGLLLYRVNGSTSKRMIRK